MEVDQVVGLSGADVAEDELVVLVFVVGECVAETVGVAVLEGRDDFVATTRIARCELVGGAVGGEPEARRVEIVA